jgi:hypothetical protein
MTEICAFDAAAAIVDHARSRKTGSGGGSRLAGSAALRVRARASSAAASCGVRTGLFAYSFGRSSGVMVDPVHVP